ncbi:MAG: lipid-A-disaccharide synthase [Hydrogenothermaceae bacterium]|nr:lipid-A-disaccharide synthase [Hydrogenothermaceae bacterium]
MKKVFVSVGEISADTYASYIVNALKDRYQFLGITGPKLLKTGVKSISTIDDISVVGLIEVFSKYKKIKKVFKESVNAIADCDVVIVVDFPGFNIKLIKEAKKLRKKVIYFISPQIWAWGYNRIYDIVKNTDLLISILPFEEDYYRPFIDENFKFFYGGHPLIDIVKPKTDRESFEDILNIPKGRLLIGLLPGSRESEVKALLPVMFESAKLLNNAIENSFFLIPTTDNVLETVIEISSKYYKIPHKIVKSSDLDFPSYEVMKHSYFSVIASGTATLEASIIGNPFVLVYKVSPITFFIGKRLVKIPFLGLPNIIAGKQIVIELLQSDFNPLNIANIILEYIHNKELYQKTKDQLAEVKHKLGSEGALNRIVESIDNFLTES